MKPQPQPDEVPEPSPITLTGHVHQLTLGGICLICGPAGAGGSGR